MIRVEAMLQFARLAALKRSNLSANDPAKTTDLENTFNQARHPLIRLGNVCDVHPGSILRMTKTTEAIKKMLREYPFYGPVSNEEEIQIIQAMNDFQVNEHW